MSGRDELLNQFLGEGRDLLGRALGDFAGLSAHPSDRGRLDGLFRSVHTLKGSAALFDLPDLTAMLHETESRLHAARTGGGLGSGDLAIVAEVLDVTEVWLDGLDAGIAPDAALLARTRLLGSRGEAARQEPAPAGRPPAWAEALVSGLAPQAPVVAIRYSPARDAYFRGDDPLAVLQSLPGLLKIDLSLREIADGAYDPFQCALKLGAACQAPLGEVRAALRLVADEVEFAVVEAAHSEASVAAVVRSVRVAAERLDGLAALVDELIIAKNAIAHEIAALGVESRALAASRAGLERTAAALHAEITGLRLVELSRLFERFPRQVREIAGNLGKSVELALSGGSVAVDKAVVEALYEPILHLVRNAIDHGVEAPADRIAAGKPERGLLTLSAQARGEEVVVEISDDGRGLDLRRIVDKAIAQNVLTPEAATDLTDEAAVELVFAPGFSTAESVSAISGRGVGMDAVRAAVAAVGGMVSLHSQAGRGMTARLTVPAHVVLTRVLTVEAGGQAFGVPFESVAEMHRVTRNEVQLIRAGRAYVRREVVTPLFRLGDILGLEPAEDPDAFTVLNLHAAEPAGVQIDRVGATFEAPLRPLGGLLSGYPGVLGTVMQGDGRVLLVLDLAELAA